MCIIIKISQLCVKNQQNTMKISRLCVYLHLKISQLCAKLEIKEGQKGVNTKNYEAKNISETA